MIDPIFLNKNLQRLFGGGGLVNPIISYEHVDYNVKYKEDNYFLIEIYAYMNKHRYTNKVKYTPKNKDCNTVRNKIFLNKIGYYFLSKANKRMFFLNVYFVHYLGGAGALERSGGPGG